MKKIICVLVLLLCVACSSPSSSTGNTSTNTSKDEMKISSFDEVISAQFDVAQPFYEGFAIVGNYNENGELKYFFVDTSGNVISKEYDYAKHFSDGMALVGYTTDNYGEYLVGYINTEGEEVISIDHMMTEYSKRYFAFYEGYAVVEDYSEEKTWLINKEGQLAEEFPIESSMMEMGFGYDGEPDHRLLTLETPFDKSEYTYFNLTQRVRMGNAQTPYGVYDKDTHMTTIYNEKFEAIDSWAGYEFDEFDGYRIVQTNFLDWSENNNYQLLDPNDNVVLDGFDYIEYKEDGKLLANTYLDGISTYAFYDLLGNRISEEYRNIDEWQNGYFLYDEEIIRVVDHQMQEIFVTEAEWISQDGSWEYVDGHYEQVYYPWFSRYFNIETEGRLYTVSELLSLTGETLLEYVPESNIFSINEEFIIRSYNNNSQVCEIILTDTWEVMPIENVYSLYQSSKVGDDYLMVATTKTENGFEEKKVLMTTDEHHRPVFTFVEETTSSEDSERVLKQNEQSQIVGFTVGDVTLKEGNVEIATSAGISLVVEGVYKKAQVLNDVYDDNWNYIGANDVILSTVDNTVQSLTYDQMGTLHEDYISFCIDGKWGYLKINR